MLTVVKCCPFISLDVREYCGTFRETIWKPPVRLNRLTQCSDERTNQKPTLLVQGPHCSLCESQARPLSIAYKIIHQYCTIENKGPE